MPIAPTTTALWPRVCWSGIRCAAPGTTRPLTCVLEKRCGCRPSIRCRAGTSRCATAKFSSPPEKTRRNAGRPRVETAAETPGRIVVVGGGAAGYAAADMLRREGYQGSIAMISNDDAPPVDRPNLSKDYLAGNAPEDWVPLVRRLVRGERDRSAARKRTLPASIHVRARSCSRTAPISRTTGCCWRPAPSRYGSTWREPISRTSSPCGRCRLSRHHRRRPGLQNVRS